MTMISRIWTTTIALATAAAIHAGAVAGEASEDVKAMAAAWDEAYNSGDAAKVASMYAEDARVITGQGEVKQGPDEIQALFQSFMDSGFKDHAIDVSTAEVNGDMGYLTGTWSGKGGDGKDYGGHLTNIVEKQDDGSWKSVVHIWN